jgi:hypothetical protein
MGTERLVYIAGQADPSRESGRPRPIKERYMMIKSITVAIGL